MDGENKNKNTINKSINSSSSSSSSRSYKYLYINTEMSNRHHIDRVIELISLIMMMMVITRCKNKELKEKTHGY